MKQFIDDGTENPKRLVESVNTLKKYLKKLIFSLSVLWTNY